MIAMFSELWEPGTINQAIPKQFREQDCKVGDAKAEIRRGSSNLDSLEGWRCYHCCSSTDSGQNNDGNEMISKGRYFRI